MKVSLVIPAYNEEKRLAPFLQSIADYLQRHRKDIFEVIVVDDGSQDRTAKVAQKFAKRLGTLRLIVHQKNQGKGAAIKTGVLAARGETIIFMDADGATPIHELPKMIAALVENQIVVGNRWIKGAKTERHSWLRRVAGWSYRRYMSLFGLGQIDTMCGFKGYQKEVARHLFRELKELRWLFDTEIAYRAIHYGYTVRSIPINWESKDGSKLSTRALLASALQIAPLIRRLKREFKQTELSRRAVTT